MSRWVGAGVTRVFLLVGGISTADGKGTDEIEDRSEVPTILPRGWNHSSSPGSNAASQCAALSAVVCLGMDTDFRLVCLAGD